jgi:hypothetical protein
MYIAGSYALLSARSNGPSFSVIHQCQLRQAGETRRQFVYVGAFDDSAKGRTHSESDLHQE